MVLDSAFTERLLGCGAATVRQQSGENRIAKFARVFIVMAATSQKRGLFARPTATWHL